MKMLVAQFCLTGSSVHGILQDRILQWGLFLMWDEGRRMSRGRLEVWLRWFAHPISGAVCKRHAFVPYPLFLFWALQK